MSGHNKDSEVTRPSNRIVNNMSLKTIFDHKERILRTLKYIEQHMDSPLRLKNLAEVACMSDFHFHRSFSYYVGDTVSGYVRKRRLAKGAAILKTPDVKVINAALAVGYETVEAFTKAFKRAYDVSPSIFQRHSQKISKLFQKRVSAILLKPCDTNKIGFCSGREAFLELSRLSRHLQLQQKDTTWISVFPDVHIKAEAEDTRHTSHRVALGRMCYELFFPRFHAEFHILKSGDSAVLHYNSQSIVYRRAARIIPTSYQQRPGHLALLPIAMRSILCVAN